MPIDAGAKQFYSCPSCKVDTPHSVINKKGQTYAVVCGNCQTTSLVQEEDLLYCQSKWAEELRHILSGLDDHTEDQ